MLAAGVPLTMVSKRLGHSTIAISADTYTHLLDGVGRDAANRAAALVPRRRPTPTSPAPPAAHPDAGDPPAPPRNPVTTTRT